ncbi:MAG TPA: hypothetical protein VKZ58_09310 [Longimicrobiales bacterium]|nr:hypothetical protein [Longimicrobiales bacterium]
MTRGARVIRGRSGRALVRATGLVTMAWLAAAGPAAARQSAPGQATELQRRLLGVTLVELHLVTGETVRGSPVGWVEDWLLLDTGRRVPAGEVVVAESLRRRTGRYWLRGNLLGAIAGGGALVAADGAGGDAGYWAPRVVAAVAGGALVGGGLGALIGATRYDRDTVYAASAVAGRREGGLIEYRLGPAPGRIRTRLAVTPYVAIGRYGYRTGRTEPPGVQYGIVGSQELGVQLQYALGPRFVARAGVGAVRTAPKYRSGGQDGILDDDMVLGRGELGLEFRTRPDVPGYFVLAVDGIHNSRGYAFGDGAPGDPDDPAPPVAGPAGLDSGVLPRIGLGLGFDVFGPNDRRFRIEWLYRIGRYHAPAVARHRLDVTRLVRDMSFSMGVHVPIVRPEEARRRDPAGR